MASIAPYTSVLGHRHGMHLLRRATFNLSKTQIDSFASKIATTAVDDLFVIPALSVSEPIDYQTTKTFINSGE